MTRPLLLAGLAAALAAPAASAQSAPPSAPPSAPRSACTPEHAARGHCAPPPAPPHAVTTARTAHPADAAFMAMMIPHHAQALDMTALVPERTGHAGLRLLAERMETAQRDEIRWMTRWLVRRGQDPAAHAGHLMDGMLTPAQMADLAAARGDAFVFKFCTYMIQHHEGALAMARTLFGSHGAAQTAEVHKLATDIEADQQADIRRMRALRASVPAVPTVPADAPAAPAGSAGAARPHH